MTIPTHAITRHRPDHPRDVHAAVLSAASKGKCLFGQLASWAGPVGVSV